jgi:glutaconyl-CoA/methylmalonyl-CoA decarboxylase subunit gamma
MKNFKFNIKGTDYDVHVISVEDNIAEVEVNGTVYKIEIDRKLQQTKTPTLVRSVVSPSTESDKSTSKTSRPTEAKGAGSIKAPLPGTILDIHVREGDKVNIGDHLLTLEAMKMENSIKSDKEGIIKEIKVRPGDAVMEGDLLLVIGVGK